MAVKAVKVLGGALQGVDAIPIEVEVELVQRLPRICIVGLAQSAVKESAERVRSAVCSLPDVSWPKARVVVNLAPADVKKEGCALDLPMALGVLAGAGRIPVEALDRVLAVGELSLAGELRPVRGALCLGMLARSLDRTLLLPRACAGQVARVPGLRVAAADDLQQVVDWLEGGGALPPLPEPPPEQPLADVDLREVKGQPTARRALEIAAAGAHHLLMMGPPGCGKSMLARRLPTILPPLRFEEALESTLVFSAAGLMNEDGCLRNARPFRAPHHSVSAAGMIGDRTLRPGEASLAHHGVLFLDEATEFPRHVLELLRTPLEDGRIRVSRAQGSIEYPAGFTLVMASNPCPCGLRGSSRPCTCSDHEVVRYRRRLSGPILDRIDLYVELEPVPPKILLEQEAGEPSEAVRRRVLAARARQEARGQEAPNGQIDPGTAEEVVQATPEARDLLLAGMERYDLSGRAGSRILKVARTIADLAGAERVEVDHLAEALAFRPCEGLA